MANIFESEITRLKETLPKTSPMSGDYKLLLDNLTCLYDLVWSERGWERRDMDNGKLIGFAFKDAPTTEAVSTATTATPEDDEEVQVFSPEAEEEPKPKKTVKKTAKAKKEEPVDADDPIEEQVALASETEEAPAATVTYTAAEVRKKLSYAATQGVNIQPIIEKFVPSGKPVKFSEIPKTAYADVVTTLEMEVANAQ